MSARIMPGPNDGLNGQHSQELLFRTAVSWDVVGHRVVVKYLRDDGRANRLANIVTSNQEVEAVVRNTAIELAPKQFPGLGYMICFYLRQQSQDAAHLVMNVAKDCLCFDDIIPGYREPGR